MNNVQQDTLETTLKGYTVAVASQNGWLRAQISRGIDDIEKFKKMVEDTITNDIKSAREQLPNFLRHLDVRPELEAELRRIHIVAFYESLKADAQTAITNIETHFFPASAPAQDNVIPIRQEPENQADKPEPSAEAPAPPTPPSPPEAGQ